jgi:hypothetical protein
MDFILTCLLLFVFLYILDVLGGLLEGLWVK